MGCPEIDESFESPLLVDGAAPPSPPLSEELGVGDDSSGSEEPSLGLGNCSGFSVSSSALDPDVPAALSSKDSSESSAVSDSGSHFGPEPRQRPTNLPQMGCDAGQYQALFPPSVHCLSG